jgi:hypothetical protein
MMVSKLSPKDLCLKSSVNREIKENRSRDEKGLRKQKHPDLFAREVSTDFLR